MRSFNAALVGGLLQARRPLLALPLYLTGLALGLAQAWPAAWAEASGPLLEPLAHGGTDAIVQLLIASEAQALAPGALGWLALALGATLVYGAAYNLFSGGALSVIAGRRGFWAGARRYFWCFTGMGVLLILLAIIALAAAALAGVLAGIPASIPVAIVLIQLISLLGEYGRAVAVSRERRSPLAALGGAAGFIGRHLPGVLALAALGLLLHWGVAAAYGAVGGRAGAAAPLAQQAAALAWVWVKQLRLGWALAYVEGATPQRAPARPQGHDLTVETASGVQP